MNINIKKYIFNIIKDKALLYTLAWTGSVGLSAAIAAKIWDPTYDPRHMAGPYAPITVIFSLIGVFLVLTPVCYILTNNKGNEEYETK
jgi:hypothetical protein